MRNRVQLAGAVLAAALLMAGLPALAVAQNEGGPQTGPPAREYVPIPAVNITGMLQSDGADGYVLVEPESGDSIALKGKKKKLSELEGNTVVLTGRWADNDETKKKFRVSKVEAAPEAAPAAVEAPATEPADATATEPAPTAAESPATPESPAPEEPEATESPESPESPAPDAPAPDAPPESPAPQP